MGLEFRRVHCRSKETEKGWEEEPGLGFIFRTNSLYQVKDDHGNYMPLALTGLDGKGRTPGKNGNNPNVIKDKITNARNKESYEIYKESPMYEITLTPGLMKEIRKYNKEKNKITVEIFGNYGIAGYADYDSMSCAGNGVK